MLDCVEVFVGCKEWRVVSGSLPRGLDATDMIALPPVIGNGFREYVIKRLVFGLSGKLSWKFALPMVGWGAYEIVLGSQEHRNNIESCLAAGGDALWVGRLGVEGRTMFNIMIVDGCIRESLLVEWSLDYKGVLKELLTLELGEKGEEDRPVKV